MTSPTRTVSYSITGGTGMGLFDINAGTGALSVHRRAVLAPLSPYTSLFRSKAADGGTPSLFTTQTVTVSLNDANDNTPSISSSAAMSVDENEIGSTHV